MYASGITFTASGSPSGGSPPGTLTGADNGLSPSTITPGNVVLGQDVGQAGAPATLLSNREIPMAGFALELTGAGTLSVNGEYSFPITSSPTIGVFYQDSLPFMHSFFPPGNTGFNLFIGRSAGSFTISGLGGADSGCLNVGIGFQAMQNLSTAHENVAIGNSAMQNSTTGFGCVAIGETALKFQTTGNINVAVGTHAMEACTTGFNNTGIGYRVMERLTTGNDNAAIGAEALDFVTTGFNNVAVGAAALFALTTGADCTAVGHNSLQSNNGNFNTAVGIGASGTTTDGIINASLGYGAGNVPNALHDDQCTYLGGNSSRDPALAVGVKLTDSFAVGYNAIVAQSNSGVLGGQGIDAVRIGINVKAPAAYLHLPPGLVGAGFAPLLFTAGVNNAAPAAGAMEYDGTNLFFTRVATRESVLMSAAGASAPATTIGAAIVNFYGTAATNFLGNPNNWAAVVIGGVTYKIPLYT